MRKNNIADTTTIEPVINIAIVVDLENVAVE